MIASVRGTIIRVAEHSIVLELPGGAIALELFMTRHAIDSMPDRIGQTIELNTITTIESLAQGATLVPRLLAFESPQQRELFELLNKVKGLGPRRVLRAMAAPVGEIATAIAAEDVRALAKLPEIGKKLAESIVLELKDKIAPLATQTATQTATDANATARPPASRTSSSARPEHAARAIAAMIKLGETPANAEQLVDAALRATPAPQSADELLAAAFARRG